MSQNQYVKKIPYFIGLSSLMFIDGYIYGTLDLYTITTDILISLLFIYNAQVTCFFIPKRDNYLALKALPYYFLGSVVLFIFTAALNINLLTITNLYYWLFVIICFGLGFMIADSSRYVK